MSGERYLSKIVFKRAWHQIMSNNLLNISTYLCLVDNNYRL